MKEVFTNILSFTIWIVLALAVGAAASDKVGLCFLFFGLLFLNGYVLSKLIEKDKDIDKDVKD